jgi:predicted amidohydrolase YtcJ
MAVATARRLGVAGLAGDLVADGAFGSRTAALSAPYADRPDTCGHAYVSAEQVREHVVACTRADLQAGFHCIGDVALENIREGFEAAERDLGTAAVVKAGHRLEHVEMPSREMIDTMSRLGILASVQPMFDGLWGGSDGMYAARLGDRWRQTNPLRAFAEAGIRLAFGSDSPVTPLGPWAAIRAALHHHAEEHRLDPATAFAAHTGGARLTVGAPADLAVWDQEPDLTTGAELPRLLRTVAAGRTIHENQEVAA